MTYKPPQVTGEFRYWLSLNAVDRFRDMVAEEKRKLSDPDLGHHLDDLIHAAILDRKFTVIVDSDAPDEDTRIVPVTARDGKTAMVVMRQYQPSGYPRPRVVGGPGKPAPYAVTVLTSESASSNYANGRWKVPNRPLADKLANVRPVKETPALPPAPAPKPEAPVVPIAATRKQAIPVLPELPPVPGPARGGTVVERIEYVKEVLRTRPNIRYGGADGLQALIKAKFGTGMSQQVVQQIRDSLVGELSANPVPAPAPLLTVGKPAPAPTPVNSSAAKLATQLAEALAHEARAKAFLAEAQLTASEATEQVERIMKELADLRK
jgi:hypothetical protein